MLVVGVPYYLLITPLVVLFIDFLLQLACTVFIDSSFHITHSFLFVTIKTGFT